MKILRSFLWGATTYQRTDKAIGFRLWNALGCADSGEKYDNER